MKKLNVLFCLFVAVIVVSSCGKYPGYKESDNGLYYKKLKSGDTDKNAKEGDLVIMEILIKGENDSVIFDSWKEPQPLYNQITKVNYKGDITEAFTLMELHDSTEFLCISDSLKKYNQFTFPEWVKPGSKIKFLVRLDSIITKEQFEKEKAAFEQKRQAEVADKSKVEIEALNKYVAENKISVKPTASGLYFIETKKGTGKQAVAGAKVQVNYAGTVLDGRMFDTSIEAMAKKFNLVQPGRKYEPFEFELGRGQVIAGWDEGIAMMKEGGKAKLIIPSHLAYGEYPKGDIISAFSTLVFEVELVKVIQ